MRFLRRAQATPGRLGIFPGSFHPPTRAHLALAQTALTRVDEVLFVMPEEFPHKRYEDVGLEARLAMLEAAASRAEYSIGVSRGGLFVDIARECRQAYPDAELFVLCGRDAAERIVNWDYGAAGEFGRMLDEFQMLVASRGGSYNPPLDLAPRIHALEVDGAWDAVSATEVRLRIRQRGDWRSLIPVEIADLVESLYSPQGGEIRGR